MSRPALSLIVATVNRTEELFQLFESLAVQTCQDFEVIVVDQNTDDRILPYLEIAMAMGLNLTHLKNYPANLSLARNIGLNAATADLIGFPDDDCWYEPDLLEQVVKRFSAEDAPAGVGVRWLEEGDPPISATRLTWERSKVFRDIPVTSFTLFFHKKLFDQIGDFDARLGIGLWFGSAEETDLVLRALYAGALLAYEPSAVVHHPVRKPVIDRHALIAARYRARGTGALWAKHDLPKWVILRGLVAPVLRPLLQGSIGAELAHGYAEMLGRLDGLLGWRRMQSS